MDKLKALADSIGRYTGIVVTFLKDAWLWTADKVEKNPHWFLLGALLYVFMTVRVF